MSHRHWICSRSVQIVRRHKILVSLVAALGLIAGARLRHARAAAAEQRCAESSCPARLRACATQVVIADSDPVLSAALPGSARRYRR